MSVHHVAIETARSDAPAVAAFFALLGFEPVDPPASLRDRALWVGREGTQIHVLYADAPVVPPSGHVAVVAPDYDEALERLRAAGFAPEPRAAHWGSPRCFVDAPGGHRVEIMAFAPR